MQEGKHTLRDEEISISYTWDDGYDIAQCMQMELNKSGFNNIFRDETNMGCISSLAVKIPTEIDKCKYFVAIVTDSYNKKVNEPGWIQCE